MILIQNDKYSFGGVERIYKLSNSNYGIIAEI